eukprot:10521797-Alexandrium_andersonii.AAC.1
MCIRDRAQPSNDERRRHERARLLFRSWRVRCVRGRMPNAPRASDLPGAPNRPWGRVGLLLPHEGR